MKSIIKNSVVKFLEPRDDIALAFLFGSVVNRDSFHDIDIAVYFVKDLPSSNYLDLRLELQLGLEKVLKKDVDLVILNNAPPFLRYKILKHGILIIEKDTATFRDFFRRTIHEYFDFLPVFNLYREKMRRRPIE